LAGKKTNHRPTTQGPAPRVDPGYRADFSKTRRQPGCPPGSATGAEPHDPRDARARGRPENVRGVLNHRADHRGVSRPDEAITSSQTGRTLQRPRDKKRSGVIWGSPVGTESDLPGRPLPPRCPVCSGTFRKLRVTAPTSQRHTSTTTPYRRAIATPGPTPRTVPAPGNPAGTPTPSPGPAPGPSPEGAAACPRGSSPKKPWLAGSAIPGHGRGRPVRAGGRVVSAAGAQARVHRGAQGVLGGDHAQVRISPGRVGRSRFGSRRCARLVTAEFQAHRRPAFAGGRAVRRGRAGHAKAG